MKRVLIAVDGSRGGSAALETGLELARASGAVATIVYVRHAPRPIIGDPYYERMLSGQLRKARMVVDEATALAAEAGVESESEILEGNPASQIVEVARLRNADLIVVGSRGLGRIAGALLGSVSRTVVHEADRPVLVAGNRAGSGATSGLSRSSRPRADGTLRAWTP